MAFNYGKLADEINADPLGRNYSGMSDQQIADDLNTEYRNVSVDSVESQDVVAAMDSSEFSGLAATQQRNLWGVIGAGAIRPDDTEVKAFFAGLFGAGTATRANLIALATQNISRANELGLGTVRIGDVVEAKAMVR